MANDNRWHVYIDTQFGPDCRGIFDTEDEARAFISEMYKRTPLLRGRAWKVRRP